MTLFVSQWATLRYAASEQTTRAATKWPPQQQQQQRQQRQQEQSLAINDMCGSKGRPHSSTRSSSRMMATTTGNKHTHTQGAPQDAACLPALAMAIVVINGRHNKWVKCPDWVSVSACVCVCVCVKCGKCQSS